MQVAGNITQNSQTYEKQNRENTCQRKIITRTRQYLRGSVICLRPWSCRDFTIIRENVQSAAIQFFSLIKNTATPLNKTLITQSRFLYIKMGQQNQALQSPTNLPLGDQFNHQHQTAILQITIPNPCNSSSCPQARRPIEAVHSFNFSIMTPLVNMSIRFLDPQIFSSITNLSSTR